MKRLFATVAVLIVAAGVTLGQKEAKNAIHLSGVVTKIAGDMVTVSVPDGSATADVLLMLATTYKAGAKVATRGDLQQGDSVNAVVVRVNQQWQAQTVKITHPKSGPGGKK